MKSKFNFLNLILWVGQFGFSALFPLCAFLLLAAWLQQRFGLGIWIVIVLGFLGLMTSFSTARSCIRSLRKAVDEAGEQKKPPISFNNHD